MVDSSLLEYVKKSLADGIPQDSLAKTLAANGWADASIKEAILLATMPADVPKGPGLAFTPVSIPSAPSFPQKRSVRNYEIYSHLSVLLAFVLFFGLLILGNKTVSDIARHFGSNITGKLIAQTFLILPFLIAAIGLHWGLTEKGAKYKILSQPYFIVSGWLLIRLLFSVSSYILNTQVVYGVYIVLVLVVGVLTGVIFFGQKFLKNKD